MNNTITLSQAVKDLYSVNSSITVKDILAILHDTNHPLASQLDLSKVYYQTVRGALLKVSGNQPKQKASKIQKTSIILDLTQKPVNSTAIPGKVYFAGKK